MSALNSQMIKAPSEKPKVWPYHILLLPLGILLSYRLLGVDSFIARLFLGGVSDVESEGFWGNQLVLGGCFLLAAIILLANSKQFLQLLKSNWLLVLFLTYTLISCFWSPFFLISFKRWIQFLGVVLIGIAAMNGPSGAKPVVYALLWITALSSIYSLFLVLFDPAQGIWPNGQWTGLFSHKNSLGSASALSCAVWLPSLTGSFNKFINRLGFIIIPITLILLVGSQSATAIVVSFTMIFVFFLIKTPIPTPIKFFFVPIPILMIYFVFLNFMSQTPFHYAVTLLGRDPTLTGRNELWAAIFANVQEHFFLGVGYNGFWVGEIGLSELVLDNFYWNINQAHNGYLDILNELGLIGLLLFILLLLRVLTRAFKYMKQDSGVGIIFLLIIISLLVSNITETTFCRQTSIGWVAFLIAYVSISPVEGIREDSTLNKGNVHQKRPSKVASRGQSVQSAGQFL